MTLYEMLLRARADLARRREVLPHDPFGVLRDACGGDGELLAAAVEILDPLTPGGWTFLQWADGAADVTGPDGSFVGLVYRYDRPKAQVLALLGRAALRARQAQPSPPVLFREASAHGS